MHNNWIILIPPPLEITWSYCLRQFAKPFHHKDKLVYKDVIGLAANKEWSFNNLLQEFIGSGSICGVKERVQVLARDPVLKLMQALDPKCRAPTKFLQ